MADKFVDHGCTLYPSIYMSVPSGAGSFPQEGDGAASGTGTAPAVSVATMDFTGATAAAGATFAVHGATLTCVASGASTVQFNAGSGSTLAANLVTAINAATAAPTVTTGGVSSPYLKALVWASSSGAVLTVYSRIASVNLNQSVNASCTLVCGATGNWTSPPATTNFSGGVSGPWSRLFNTVALTANINASVGPLGTYGALVATMMGTVAAADVVHVRTGRSSADITVNIVSTTNVTIRNVGSATTPWELRFDNGTIWNDGNSNGVFIVDVNTASVNFGLYNLGYLYWHGQMETGASAQSGGVVNSRFHRSASDASGYFATLAFSSIYGTRGMTVEGMEISDAGLGSTTSKIWHIAQASASCDSGRPVRFVNCKFGVVRAASGIFGAGGSYGGAYETVDCLFAYGGAAQYTSALCHEVPTAAFSLKLIRPKFTGGGGGHHILMAASAGLTAPSHVLSIEDPVDMGQFIISDSAASFCGRVAAQASTAQGAADFAVGQFLTSNSNGRDMVIDTPRRLLEWRPTGFPTTGLSELPDGTDFSVRFSMPHTGLAAGLVSALSPVRALKQININTLGDDDLTVTEHILIDASYGGSSYTPTDAEWWIEGTYVSSADSTTKTFSTRGTGTNLASDSQSWSSLTFSPFAGSSRTYSRWKITVALTGVKDATEVSLYLVSTRQPATMVEWCFIDPQFQMAPT